MVAQMARRPGRGSGEDFGGKMETGRESKQRSMKGDRGMRGQAKRPRTVHYALKNERGGIHHGRGHAGMPPVPPSAPYVIDQSNQRLQTGSGHWGRGRWNQRRSQVATLATIVEEGEAGH